MFYPHYLECCVKTVVVRDGDRYVPDLPKTTLGYGLVLTFCNGRNLYEKDPTPEMLGMECICHVVYHTEDAEILDKFAGKLGKGNEVTKLDAYKTVVVKTVADQKIEEAKAVLIAEAAKEGKIVDPKVLEAVKYDVKDHPDALDGVALWVFQTKEYTDK